MPPTLLPPDRRTGEGAVRHRWWPIRPTRALAAAGSEGERRREVRGPDPWPQLGQRWPAVAGVAPLLSSVAAKRRGKRRRAPRGTYYPPWLGLGCCDGVGPRWPAGSEQSCVRAVALGLGRRRGSWWWRLRSSEAGQGPLYSRRKAVGRVERGGGGRRAARSAFNGAPAACSCRGAAARAARPVRGEGTARAGLASGPAALWLTAGGAASSAARGHAQGWPAA